MAGSIDRRAHHAVLLRGLRRLGAAVVAALLSACGGGTVAIASGGSSSGGSVATTVSDVTVSDTKNSPAQIAFTLRGETANSVRIEYQPPTGAASAADGGAPEPVPIATLDADQVQVSPSGATNVFSWSFDGTLSSAFTDGLSVRVSLDNGASAETSVPVSVGNDAPEISNVTLPEGEIVGGVPMFFTVTDDDDLVNVTVEVNVDEDGGFPESGWVEALTDNPSGSRNQAVIATPDGTTLSFHWDVQQQFPALDSQVLVRIHVDEPIVDEDCTGSADCLSFADSTPAAIRVDNNQPPIADLDDSGFLLSDDQRLGIVVPYTVSDVEGDTVDLVFQWTREGEPFPDLPVDEQALQAILDDPAQRKTHRIATPYPRPIAGRIAKPTANTVELPELASSQAGLLRVAEHALGGLTHALDGLDLELLRSSGLPDPLAATWPANPLNQPVAALPTARGTTALVLDHSAGGQWRLREIDLGTGDVVRELATDDGEPDALALERGGAGVLIASHVGLSWRLTRVDLESLELSVLFEVFVPTGGIVRGLASASTHVALATVGDDLLRLDYTDPLAPRMATLVDGLATPWGLVLDPLATSGLYLAERDGGADGRVLAVDLDTHVTRVVLVDPPGLPHPEQLAIEHNGTRLLVVTDAAAFDGFKELRALEMGAVAGSSTEVLSAELPDTTAGLATGDDGLRLLALESAHDLAAGGGIAQRRTIVGYDPSRRVVTVEPEFAPPPEANQPWRPASLTRLTPEPGLPRSGSFVWDSGDLPGDYGSVLLRATARDADPTSAEHDGGKVILSGLQGTPFSVGDSSTSSGPVAMAVADVDRNGNPDLVSANQDGSLTLFLQTGASVFEAHALPVSASAPDAVTVADVDGDGNLDVVSGNGGHVSVCFQTGGGSFNPSPLIIPTDNVLYSPVAAADVDGDGDTDLLSTVHYHLLVLYQTGPGSFTPTILDAPGGSYSGASSVLASDLDGEGDLDLVLAWFEYPDGSSLPSRNLTVFLQVQPSVFEAQGVFDGVGPSKSEDPPGSVAAADVDGDGDLDLVAVGLVSDTISVFLQTDVGVFDRRALSVGGASTTHGPNSVAVADLDGDGNVELITANQDSDSLTVFTQTGAGRFDEVPLTLTGAAGPRAVVAADLDGDGTPDLVSANHDSDTLAIYRQTVASVFQMGPESVGNSETNSLPEAVVVADVNGDGDQDLVSANFGFVGPVGSNPSTALTVFSQNEHGGFDADPQSVGSPAVGMGGSTSVAANDMDGDGDVDLVAANYGANSLSVFSQLVTGSFTEMEEYFSFPACAAVADIDSDGDQDLVGQGISYFRLFFQTEVGVFGQTLDLEGASTSWDSTVIVVDIDGNGDMDLVSAHGALVAFLQNGPGSFTGPQSIPGATGFSVAAADIDGDGDLDLAAANGSELTVSFQTSPGGFDAATPIGAGLGLGPVAVAVADMDGDGDMDLVSANFASSTLAVFFQVVAGAFDSTPLIVDALGSKPTSVAVADVDGDGDLDLVSANRSNHSLMVFFASHRP